MHGMEWSKIRRRIQKLPDDKLAEEARASKVPHGTLWNIKHGFTKNPRVQTYLKLVRWAERKGA